MKEKSVTFTKEKSKFFQNHLERGDFYVENFGLFSQSQCLLTQPKPLGNGNVRQEIINLQVAS